MIGSPNDLYCQPVSRAIQWLDFNSAPGGGKTYPADIRTPGQKALYDNIGDLEKALEVHEGVLREAQHGWREIPIRKRKLRQWLAEVFTDEAELERIFAIIEANHEY